MRHPVALGHEWVAVARWLETPAGKARFAKDHGAWSAFKGKSKALAEAQKRMARLPGAAELLRSLVAFEPARRCSARRAMQAELFAPYRCDGGGAGAEEGDGMAYLHYLCDAPDDPPEEQAA